MEAQETISRQTLKSRRYRAKYPGRATEYNRKYVAERRELYDEHHRRGSLRRHYGLTIAQYDAMFETQKGLCAICGEPETKMNKRTGKVWRLAVDHDKITKKIGGLLCNNCNIGIGFLDHSIETIKAAIVYIKERNLAATPI